jgi:hypothetical protein
MRASPRLVCGLAAFITLVIGAALGAGDPSPE